MSKKQSPRKIQSENKRIRAPLKSKMSLYLNQPRRDITAEYGAAIERKKAGYSQPALFWMDTYRDAAEWAKEITGAWYPEGAPDGHTELVEIAEEILRHWNFIQSYDAWNNGIGESFIKEFDRFILKAQILIDPTSRTAQKKAKIGGKKISRDAAARAAKVKVEVDRIKGINSNIEQMSLARNIGKKLNIPTETVRGIIKKHGW